MKLDPVTLEILGNKVTALTEEMCLTLQRTGRTLYVKETADFCCALAALDGKFFAYPRGIGVSGFVGLDCLPAIEAVGELAPGDVILTNDPYRSRGLATHLPDLQVIEPYFHDGRIVAYGWAFLHASDVGGKVPSSISPSNHDIFQEGLQIPPVKLVRGGVLNQDVILFLRANSRTPDANIGDLHAMLGALSTGRRRVASIIAQHGAAAFLDIQSDLLDYAERRARAVLGNIAPGTYRYVDYLDDEAGSGLPVRLALAITVGEAEGGIHLDFTGTDPQVAAAINIPSHGQPHAWLTLRILALICTLDKSVPLNGGLLRPIRITAQAGSLVNPMTPAAVGVRHAAAVRVNDALNGVLGQAMPEVMPAASGGTIIPVVVAEPARHGPEQNVQVIEPMVGGTGARRGVDGADGRDSSISNLANNPVETVEAETGVEILHYGLRPDSGGAGQWRGGTGQVISFRILQDDTSVLARGMERLKFQPWGTQGGRPGANATLTLNPGTPQARVLGKIDLLPVNADDVLTLETPGGGGWGDPFQRDPQAVLADVARGLVSTTRAARDYGVAIRDGRIDAAETQRLRAGMAPGSPRGAARDAWDDVFDDASLDALNAALFALPAARRSRRRRQIFDTVLAPLGTAFPGEPAVKADRDAARERLARALQDLGTETATLPAHADATPARS